jgi:TonB family protein
MSHKNKIREKFLTDIARYHRNEMTGEERNSFERVMQKDPFAAEAAEGLASISQEKSCKDLNDLQKSIKHITAGKQRFMVYRIAASLVVLIGITALFILIEKNKTVNRLADNSGESKKIEIINSKPITESVAEDAITETRASSPEKLKSKSVTKENLTSTGGNAVQVVKSETKAISKNDSVSERMVQPAEAYIAREQMAAPEKERSLPAIKDINAKADLQNQVKPDSAVTVLSEVVVVGYGTKKSESEKKDVLTGYVPPQPLNGKAEFDKYVQTNLHRPDNTTDGQRIVVVVSFLVRTDGSVDSIRIVRSPGKQFSDEAIRIIQSGPSWKPAEDNGKPIEDKVRMRIVFK